MKWLFNMEQEEPIHKGTLLLPPAGKLLLKKSWQPKHCLLFKASKFGIGRLEIYDDVDSKESKIITLENCIKVNAKSPTTFCITTKSLSQDFGTTTEHLLSEWLTSIQSVAFPDEVSKKSSMEEDNELYCSSGEEVFNVKLVQWPASEKCRLENKTYILMLTSMSLQLRNIADSKLLYTWPYRFIRRYGYKSEMFTFEAGRLCDTGEGTFYFEHTNQRDIFRSLASKMNSMKKLLAGKSSPILDCGELQLHAALSMEARSRTPLPPSPTSAAMIQEVTLSSASQISLPDLDHGTLKPAIRSKPLKPPRKCPPPNNKPFMNTTSPNEYVYEPIDKYDQIEYRNDAWRTLGVDSPNHTEQFEDDGEDYMSWGTSRKKDFVKPTIQTVAPQIITQTSTTDLDDTYYDKLNFFGSSSKLNVKSGYKQVKPSPVVPVPAPPSFNEYDEVQCPDMEPVRPADDSHLGYALVRKDPGKDSLKEAGKEGADKKGKGKNDKVPHQFHNEEPYAVISKPKRV